MGSIVLGTEDCDEDCDDDVSKRKFSGSASLEAVFTAHAVRVVH